MSSTICTDPEMEDEYEWFYEDEILTPSIQGIKEPIKLHVEVDPEMKDEYEWIYEDEIPTCSIRGIKEPINSQVEVERYCKRALCKNDNRLYQRILSAKSKAVQTDSGMSGVPPSWFTSVQELVNEVHTGLGNLINLHYPADSRKVLPSEYKMKHFGSENGHYQSKLLPNMRLPADGVIASPQLEDIKEMLNSVFESACKLKSVIPDFLDTAQQVPLPSSEKESTTLSKSKSGVIKQIISVGTVPKLIDIDFESEVPLSYSSPVSSSSRYAKLEISDRNSIKYEEFCAGINKRSSTNEIDCGGGKFKGGNVHLAGLYKPKTPQVVSRRNVHTPRGILKYPQKQYLSQKSPRQIDGQKDGIGENASPSSVLLGKVSKTNIRNSVLLKTPGSVDSCGKNNDKLRSIVEKKLALSPSDGRQKNFIKWNILALQSADWKSETDLAKSKATE